MKILDLSPIIDFDGNGKEILVFSCPKCEKEKNCMIVIPIGDQHNAWKVQGGDVDFEKITITPSIWHHCKSDPHFFITSGNISMC